MAKVVPEPNTGCWLWTGEVTVSGYGQFWDKLQKKTVRSHRWIYKKVVGDTEDGMYICHKCDVPACVNPAHLFQGTPKDNMVDCSIKGRVFNLKKTHCQLGHPYNAENTRIQNNYRRCIQCARIDSLSRYYKTKQSKTAKEK